jgi:anion-transporting  ArsA/GET3 family ATPase
MLARPTTAFVVVTTAEPQPILEAQYFIERLRKDGMRLAALIVNRVAPARHQITSAHMGELSSTSQYILSIYKKQSRIRVLQDTLISENTEISIIPRITVSDMGSAITDLSGLARLGLAMNDDITI